VTPVKLWGMLAALAIAGCGLAGKQTCPVDADVQAVALNVPDSAVTASSETAALRVGQAVDICMIGSDGCTRVDQRFEFQTDAPAVVSIVMSPSVVSDGCNQLSSTHVYPCCTVRTGRLTALGVGEAQLQAVLLRGSTVEKTAGLVWCTPLGAGAHCRPLTGVQVAP